MSKICSSREQLTLKLGSAGELPIPIKGGQAVKGKAHLLHLDAKQWLSFISKIDDGGAYRRPYTILVVE